MAKKIIRHVRAKKMAYLLSLTAMAVAFGFYLSFFGIFKAEAVSGVILTDPDTTGFGVDGRDFQVTWTPGAQPAGYMNTMVYIVSSSINLTTSSVMVNACNGNPCSSLGSFINYQTATFTLPQYQDRDSAGVAWATSTSYVAWVYVMSTTSTIVSSSPVSYSAAYDTVSDSAAPFIEHMSVHTARGGAAAVITSFLSDDQTTMVQFGDPVDGGAEYFKLFYGADLSSSSTSTDGIILPGDETVQFVIPTSSVPAASSTFEYYLVARDRASNVRFFCANFGAATEADCQSNPFVVNTVSISGAGRTVSGNITSGGVGLAGAKVSAGGFAGALVSTNASGTYSLTGLPDNNSFDIGASKGGYCRAMRFEAIGTTDKTNINMSLNLGNCSYGGGTGTGAGAGGGGGSPQVTWSGPPDGMNGVPLDTSMRVGFNQPMNAATINDNMATGTADNVYLTTDDGTTKIAGSVMYCENSGSPGCSSLMSMEQNVLLFAPSASLSSSSYYSLVITERVLSTAGQQIQGNRPSGGHRIGFSTSGGTFNMGSFGTSGQFMPPYVQSMTPAPGVSAAPNTSIVVEFNKAMNSATVTSTNITLHDMNNSGASVSLSSITLDSNQSRFVTIQVASGTLQAGREYELRVKGAVASNEGMSMRPTGQTNEIAFRSSFNISSAGVNDAAAPTIYPLMASGTAGMAVNNVFSFGFSEPLSISTINTSNITLRRGATTVAAGVSYNPSDNTLAVAPNTALAPNTAYILTFGAGITDLAGNALTTSSYTYTTGAADTVLPTLREVRCDDYNCRLFFSEAMNRDARADSNWASSSINHFNINLTQGGADRVVTSSAIVYNAHDYSVEIQGVGLTTGGGSFTLTVSGVTDLSGNVMASTAIVGTVENSAQTFGSFGDAGMFGPPTTGQTGGGGVGQGEFRPQGFGSFTADQFAMGQAVMAYPFNPMASQDSNVFQVRFSPDVALQDNDQVIITFPNGTTVTNAALDTYSPYYADFNQFADGTVTGTAISANNTTREVTVTLGVDGTLRTTDNITIDMRRITNPAIPKSFDTGGYTVTIKVVRGGTTLVNKTSMPYFITDAGTNTIIVDVVAGSATSSPTVGASGNLFVRGGGPGGPLDKLITLTDGDISAVEGSATTVIRYSNLSNGCYFVGTEPFITLGGADYFGQMAPEPICVNGGQSQTKYILLTSASGGSAVTTTVKLVGSDGNPFNFNGADVEIFAGGPGRFVVKTLDDLGTANSSGYTLRLPSNGHWFVGVGPAMPKGTSGGMPTQLPANPPPPLNIETRGVGTGSPSVSLGMGSAPPGVSFNDNTDTISFTFAAADKTVSGTVRDGSGNPLNGVQVFLHRKGFGAPTFGTSNASGTFSLAVSDYGMYEIGTWKEGMPPSFKQLEVRPDGADAGTAPDIYLEGKQITGANPLILKLRKASYSISGKVLDSNSQGIVGAPVFATNADGDMMFGNTRDGGNYTLFVDAGAWTVRSEVPPSESNTCGRLVKTVTVTTANQANQNITPSASTCYTLSGIASVGSTTLNNMPLFVEEWDATNSVPLMGGMRRNVSTDSSGAYSVKVAGDTTYRLGTWHPDYGELSATKAVTTTSTSQNLTVSATTTITLNFTGGTASMKAFIELKNSANSAKRLGKTQNGLDSAVTFTGEQGVTYNYFVDVFGVGKFTGTVTSSATIALGVSAGEFVTVTGTIYSNTATGTLTGALVTFTNTSTGAVVTALTDNNGRYSVDIKSGNYVISADAANYLTVPTTTPVTFSTTTAAYDFGGASADRPALDRYDYLIEGTVSSSAGAAMTDGHVWATNASGTTVTAPIDSADGSYSLPVTMGTWTVYAVGPLHAQTTSTVVVTSTDVSNGNFALTASTTLVATSTSGIISADTGGSINDSGESGIKLTAGQGVLATDDQDITLSLERSYEAPDTANFAALGNANFSIEAQGETSALDLTGNVDIQINYTDLLGSLPSGVNESDLKLMYYSTEADQYIPVEGGFTIDATNNTITGAVDHLTDFVITYVPPASSPGSPSPSPAPTVSPSGGGTPAVDTTPPANASVVIAGGASTTANASVTLTLAATDATQMMISNTSSFPGGAWEAYATSKSWTLTAGTGLKTVYAKFRDAAGNVSAAVSDTITVGAAGAQPVAATSTTPTAPTSPSQPAATTVAPSAAAAARPSASVSAPSNIFRRALRLGSTGTDVRRLQEKLKELGYYTYSKITGLYGKITAKAVSALQRAQGWRPVGVVGPKTLELLNSLSETESATPAVSAPAAPSAASGSYAFERSMRQGSTGADVRRLQEKLKELGYFTYPSITGSYGPVTAKAVSALQRAQGWRPVGVVGPKTLELLNGLTVSESVAPAPSASAPVQKTMRLGSVESANSLVAFNLRGVPQSSVLPKKVSYSYSFTNEGVDAERVQLVRHLMNEGGNVVAQSVGVRTVRGGASVRVPVTQTFASSLAEGNYRVHVEVKALSDGETLAENVFNFTVAEE